MSSGQLKLMGMGYTVTAPVVLAVLFAVYPDSTPLIGVAFGAVFVAGVVVGRLLFVGRTRVPAEPRSSFRLSPRCEVSLFGFAAPLLLAAGIAALSAAAHFLGASIRLQIDLGALTGAIGAAFMAFFGVSFVAEARRSADSRSPKHGFR